MVKRHFEVLVKEDFMVIYKTLYPITLGILCAIVITPLEE